MKIQQIKVRKHMQSDKADLWCMDFIGINSYFLQSLHF